MKYKWEPVSFGHNIIRNHAGKTLASLDMFLGYWRLVMATSSCAKSENDLVTFELLDVTANVPAPFERAMALFLLTYQE